MIMIKNNGILKSEQDFMGHQKQMCVSSNPYEHESEKGNAHSQNSVKAKSWPKIFTFCIFPEHCTNVNSVSCTKQQIFLY